jgi:hypothetical protein
MALTDKLTAEKAGLESYLDSERGAKLEQSQIDRLDTLNSLLGIGSGSGGSSGTTFTNSPTNFGAANQAVLKASAGAVFKIYCYNKSATTRFFQIHNKATAPINTDVPIESFPIASNTALILDSTFWGATGRVCSTGVAWAFSSTETTLTLASAADQTSSVGYL